MRLEIPSIGSSVAKTSNELSVKAVSVEIARKYIPILMINLLQIKNLLVSLIAKTLQNGLVVPCWNQFSQAIKGIYQKVKAVHSLLYEFLKY